MIYEPNNTTWQNKLGFLLQTIIARVRENPVPGGSQLLLLA